jgi:hypothetical protein
MGMTAFQQLNPGIPGTVVDLIKIGVLAVTLLVELDVGSGSTVEEKWKMELLERL